MNVRSLIPTRDDARTAHLRSVVEAVLAGDLTARTFSTSRDGLGELERVVDALLDRFTSVVGTVQAGVDDMAEARIAAAHVHKDMLDAAEMTAGMAYDVGVTTGHVSDNMNVVASATEELNATISEVAHHATFAADIAATAVTQGDIADKGVRELTAALHHVDELADMITTIARRTHMLALNAKIEAERAGDAGRGFAVVAAEVNELARQTADATQQVRSVVAGINDSSEHAATAIEQITTTLAKISESTSSIASAVTQQTATTREIGRVSGEAAAGASDIAGRVRSVHDRAREVAYVGAQTDAAKSETFARLEKAMRATVEAFDVGGFVADLADSDEQVVDQAARNREGTISDGAVTTVLDYVMGDGLNEFNYQGAWLHGNGYETDAGGDAYCSVPGDSVTLRFVGTRIRFYGSIDKQQGMAQVWVDDQEPAVVDFYSPVRASHTLLWESPPLPRGEHTFHLVVSPEKNLESRYFWASVAKVEILHG